MTFNGLGGSAAIAKEKLDPRVHEYLSQSDDAVRHYFVNGDLVSRLGDGHLGGHTYLLQDPALDTARPLPFAEAHFLDTIQRIVDQGKGFQDDFAQTPDYLSLPYTQGIASQFSSILNGQELDTVEAGLRSVAALMAVLTLLPRTPDGVPGIGQGELDRLLQAVFLNFAESEPVENWISRANWVAAAAIPFEAILGRVPPQVTGASSLVLLGTAVLLDGLELGVDQLQAYLNAHPDLKETVGDIANSAGLADFMTMASEFGTSAIDIVRSLAGDDSVFPEVQLVDGATEEGGSAEILLRVVDRQVRFGGESLMLTVLDPDKLALFGPGVFTVNAAAGQYRVQLDAGSEGRSIGVRGLTDADANDDFVLIQVSSFPISTLFENIADEVLTVASVDVRDLYQSEFPTLLTGTMMADTIKGEDGNEELRGFAGSDALNGHGGDDLIDAGTGNDIVDGGEGNDILLGDAGEDALRGGDGDDRLDGGLDGDVLYGAAGRDTLLGGVGTGADFLAGGSGDDILRGGPGSDLLDADGNYDVEQRGWDFDILLGPMPLQNGTVQDIIEIPTGVSLDWRFVGEEKSDLDPPAETDGNDHVDGGEGADLITGWGGDDVLLGGEGNDRISGGWGADWILGGADHDWLTGGEGDDRIQGDAGHDLIYGNEGSDHIQGGDGHDLVFGDQPASLPGMTPVPGHDSLRGGAGNDELVGGDGDDFLGGDDGDDVLWGDDGRDLLVGGTGADVLYGGADDDHVEGGDGQDELAGDSGNDTLIGGAGADVIEGGDGDDLVLGGLGADWILGGDGADELRGGGDGDTLHGGGGADRLYGGEGQDHLYGDGVGGGLGDDFLDGGSGDDLLTGGQGHDVLLGGAGRDVLQGEGGDDDLQAGSGDDQVYAGAGHDQVLAGPGDDRIDGGDGDDRLDGGAGDDVDFRRERLGLSDRWCRPGHIERGRWRRQLPIRPGYGPGADNRCRQQRQRYRSHRTGRPDPTRTRVPSPTGRRSCCGSRQRPCTALDPGSIRRQRKPKWTRCGNRTY